MTRLLDLLNPYRWALLGLLVAAAVAGAWALEKHIERIGYDRRDVEAKADIAALKSQAAEDLARETDKAATATRALNFLKNEQEITDATNEGAITLLADRLHAAGQLRDPNARRCPAGGGGPQAADPARARGGADDPAQTAGLLSAELDGLLKRLTREADEINRAYASCRADALNVRAVLAP